MRFAYLAVVAMQAVAVFAQPIEVEKVPKREVTPAVAFSVFPTIPIPQGHVPQTPIIETDPDAVPVLLPGQLFVIQSDVKFILRASPRELITYRKVAGPRDISGVFADGGTGKDEDRIYDKPFLAIVKAAEGKTGQVELLYIPVGASDDDAVLSQLINIGAAPRPPPVVPDVPKPDTPPIVPTPAVDTFKTLIQSITEKYAALPVVDRPKIAAAFREASIKVDGGQITNMQQLTKVTADLITDKIGMNGFFPWVPWRDDVTKALKTQALTTPKDHVKPWNTIADVLEGK